MDQQPGAGRVTVEEVAGYPIFQRSKECIERALSRAGFEVVKTTRCLYHPDPSARTGIADRIHVVRKVEGLSEAQGKP